jgi:hypothetical protein
VLELLDVVDQAPSSRRLACRSAVVRSNSDAKPWKKRRSIAILKCPSCRHTNGTMACEPSAIVIVVNLAAIVSVLFHDMRRRLPFLPAPHRVEHALVEYVRSR